MTEFTSEFITNWKHAIKVVVIVRGDMREVEKFALEALDEIERLQKENKELKEFVDATRPTGICEICTSNVISRYEPLQARVEELEEALAKIASYESMRFRLSPYEYGVLEQIVGIAEHALRDGES
jgi:hypothetical protein